MPPQDWISCWCWASRIRRTGRPTGRRRLAELFDAHHYTDGLSFVPQGTPSNNTEDAPSGFSSTDPGHEESYLAERTAPAFQPGDGSNADVLTTALGLANAGPVFANLPNATAKEQLDARHMNTALWQATWGYFLLQMLGVGATRRKPADRRRHRLGAQPFHRLRACERAAAGPARRQAALWRSSRDLAQRLEATSRPGEPVRARRGAAGFSDPPARPMAAQLSGSAAPRPNEEIDQEKGIDKDLAEVLSMDGLSSSYSMRHLMGRHYLEHLWVFLSADSFLDVWNLPIEEPLRSWSPSIEVPPDLVGEKGSVHQAARAEGRLPSGARDKECDPQARGKARLDHGKRPPSPSGGDTGTANGHGAANAGRDMAAETVAGRVFAARRDAHGRLVQADQGLSLSPNYIESLLAARDLDAIRNDTVQQPPPRTLLYLLLRHSMLLEYAAAASRLLINRGLLQPALRREPELVDLPAGHS